MNPNKYPKISVKHSTRNRLNNIRKLMCEHEPDKFDQYTSYNTVISWLIDTAKKSLELENDRNTY